MTNPYQWIAALLLLLFFTPLLAESSIYTWTDEDGNLHFSDQPLAKHNPTHKAITLDDNRLTIIPSVEPIQPGKHNKRATPQENKEDKPSKAALAQDRKCERLERKLKKLRAKMRTGYTAKQAPKLLNKERELKDDIDYECQNDL
jgi:hypothetical protein